MSPESAFLAAVWRRKFTILFLALLGGVAGYLGSLATPPVYEASASLLYRFESEYFPRDPSADGWQGDQVRIELSDAIQTDMEILGSRRLLGDALDRVGGPAAWNETSGREPVFYRPWIDAVRARVESLLPPAPDASVPDPAATRDATLSAVRDALGLRRVEGTSVVDLSLEHENPVLASRFLEGLIAAYFDERAAIMDRTPLDAIETEVEKARDALEAADRATADFRRENGLHDIPTQRTYLLDQRNRESNRLADVIDPRIAAMTVTSVPDTASRDVELASMRADRARALARLADVEEQLTKLADKEAELARLDRAVEARQDELDRVAEIRERLGLSARLGSAAGPAISVLDAPLTAPGPIGLSGLQHAIFGAILGAILGLGLALLRAWRLWAVASQPSPVVTVAAEPFFDPLRPTQPEVRWPRDASGG